MCKTETRRLYVNARRSSSWEQSRNLLIFSCFEKQLKPELNSRVMTELSRFLAFCSVPWAETMYLNYLGCRFTAMGL